MVAPADLERLRAIRSNENTKLKPSPYIKLSYLDEYGDEHPVHIRNYQAQGVMNLLQMERMLLGDDTGLGKSLEALAAIGYIWLVEPDYIPIIITTKSALFQWEQEVSKFLTGMEAVTVYGEPHKRHAVYEEFFLNHTPDKKRVLLLTYDMIMYDMEASVIKSRGKSPRPGFTKELKVAKAKRKFLTETSEALKGAVKDRIATAPFEVQEYARYLAALWFEKGLEEVPTEAPVAWTQELTQAIFEYIGAKRGLKELEEKVAALKNEYAPPKPVPGIIDYITECQKLHPSVKYMLVVDEIQKCKNHKSQFHEKTKRVADVSTRCVGMTATPVKNRLMEFFGVFRVIQPSLFPKITHFMNAFCVTKMQRISGGRQIPIVVGYRNLDEFVRTIEPYYLSRKKHDVAKELPDLISREVECELSYEQEELYDMAESGAENVDPSIEDSSSEVLKALTLCQQAANAPQLILDHEGVPFEGESSKIKTLLDFLEEDASEQKVIVFSRFEKMISLVEKNLNEHKIKNTRITGKENDPKLRQKNRERFQDPKSGINVILITTAGSESLNLQAAEHFVFLDLPWSWGDYVQLIGRMIRIGSVYTTVIAHHYLSRRSDGGKTIDHHVLKALRSKKNLADKVAGANLQGGLKFAEGDILRDVLAMMRGGRQSTPEFREKAVLIAHSNPVKKKSAGVKKKSMSGSAAEDNINYPPIDFSDL
jgi:SNF2 family DNA or RNA helicase